MGNEWAWIAAGAAGLYYLATRGADTGAAPAGGSGEENLEDPSFGRWEAPTATNVTLQSIGGNLVPRTLTDGVPVTSVATVPGVPFPSGPAPPVQALLGSPQEAHIAQEITRRDNPTVINYAPTDTGLRNPGAGGGAGVGRPSTNPVANADGQVGSLRRLFFGR